MRTRASIDVAAQLGEFAVSEELEARTHAAMSRRLTFVLAALVSVAAACGSTPPPKKPDPPAPAPVATAKPKKQDPFDKPTPKPPPKCEAMSESCVADKMTQAKIPEASFVVFTPPNGWTFAQETTATVAQASDDGPALAVAAFTVAPDEAKSPAKLDHRRETLLSALGERLGLKMPKSKIFWKKADRTLTVGSFGVSLYRLEGGARGSKKGPLLVFTSSLTADVSLLGVGFDPDDDPTDADEAILTAIQSLAPAPAPATTTDTKSDSKYETKTETKKDPFGEKKTP
jgi:hypothetical protein